jgi:hypothetical protein
VEKAELMQQSDMKTTGKKIKMEQVSWRFTAEPMNCKRLK